MGNLFTELMRRLFGLLDHVVIFLIETLYNLIMMIADTNVLGDLIYHYLGRIYVFLGIFMVFKLSFSMITYVINPDEFTDKGKGFGKIISNVIISLILLVATPTLFNVAFDIQSDILNTNAVYQIVTGYKLEGNSEQAKENNKTMGKKIAYGIYSTFVYKTDDPDNPSFEVDLKGDVLEIAPESCKDPNNPYCLVKADTILAKANGKFSNQYWYLVSTICGVFVAYILLTFCFDTAVRSVKLGFLQIIAPIPILSLLDPKKGNDQLMKWVKECGKTFADLFIRLAGLFLVVDIIGVILGTNEDVKGMYLYSDPSMAQTNLFVRLFVIIGLLMFAKQMPQLISDLLGIKLDGDGFSLKKKLGGLPGAGLGKALGAGALGFAGGMAANALAAKKNFSWDKGQGFWKNMGTNALGLGKSVGSMTAGGVSGLGRGAFSKEKSLWKAGAAGVAGAVGARNLRADRVAAGDGGLKGYARRAGVGVSNWAGIPSGATMFDKQISSYDNFLKEQSSLYSYAESKVAEDAGFMVDNFKYTQADGTEFTWTGGALNLAQEQAALTRMEQDPNVDTATLVNQRSLVEAMKKKATTDYITMNKDDGGAVQAALSNLEYMRSTDSAINAEIGGPITDGAAVESAKKTIKGAKSRTTSSPEYRQAQVNKKMDAKK